MKYTIATALTIGLLLSACSTENPIPAKEGNMMNQDTQQIAGRPDLTAPEVLTKVLDFLRYAKSPEDFRIETAEKVMKIKFIENKDKQNDIISDFYLSNNFGNTDWSWAFNFKKTQSGKMNLFLAIMAGIPLPHRFARWIWISSILCWYRQGLPIQGRDVWVSLSTAMKKNIQTAINHI